MATNDTHGPDTTRLLLGGAAAGIAGSIAMGMFAMVASATYQHHGFFTPLFHISALVGSPKSMMEAMNHAMAGSRFWFTPGAALVGAAIHMMAGAMFGMTLAVAARRTPTRSLLPTGAAFGVMAYLMSAFVLLPVAASIFGAGSTISDMASMVGHGTFFVEHVLFGVVTAGVWSVLADRLAGRATRDRAVVRPAVVA